MFFLLQHVSVQLNYPRAIYIWFHENYYTYNGPIVFWVWLTFFIISYFVVIMIHYIQQHQVMRTKFAEPCSVVLKVYVKIILCPVVDRNMFSSKCNQNINWGYHST
jgi:hypothetical protein